MQTVPLTSQFYLDSFRDWSAGAFAPSTEWPSPLYKVRPGLIRFVWLAFCITIITIAHREEIIVHQMGVTDVTVTHSGAQRVNSQRNSHGQDNSGEIQK